MKLSRAAQRNAATVQGPVKRATYCRHWLITELRCGLEMNCLAPEHCPYYEDAQAFHLNRLRREGRLLERTI